MKKKAVITVALLIVLSLLLGACAAGVAQEDYDAVVAERDAAQAQIAALQTSVSGDMVFRRSCVGCHGPQGWGTMFGAPIVGVPSERVKAQVREAAPPMAMPGFGPELISDSELQLLVEYVSTFEPPSLSSELRASLEQVIQAAEAEDKEALKRHLGAALAVAPPELQPFLGTVLGFVDQPPPGLPPGVEFEIAKTDIARLLGEGGD